jgi:hypothetical protein
MGIKATHVAVLVEKPHEETSLGIRTGKYEDIKMELR